MGYICWVGWIYNSTTELDVIAVSVPGGQCAKRQSNMRWLRLVIKRKVIVTVSVETDSNPYGNLAETEAFNLKARKV